MQFLEMIDALEDMVAEARRVPGTGRVMLDREEVAQVLDRMRATAPAELREAEEVREKGEAIVNEAYVFAKKMRSRIEEDRRQAVSQSNIVEEAHEKAAEILKNAEREGEQIKRRMESDAARLVRDSDGYALQTLESLSAHLDEALQRHQALQREAVELRTAVDNGLRLLGARGMAAAGGRSRTRDGKTNGNGNGHGNGAETTDASLNEDELVTLASGRS